MRLRCAGCLPAVTVIRFVRRKHDGRIFDAPHVSFFLCSLFFVPGFMPSPSQSKAAAHWKRLGLLEGAPECAIEAAWLWHIALHHPDRGGDANLARQINVARDELKGEGAKANEYVATHYELQPWLVLGIERTADAELAQRVGRQLASELRHSHRRLAERVEWAIANFGRPVTAPNGAGAN